VRDRAATSWWPSGQVRHVQAHGDAVEAFAALARFDPTLILTDWEMKPVDGLRFVRRIRRGDDSPNRYVSSSW